MHPELRDKHTHKAHRGCQTAQGDTDELLGLPPLPTHAALSLVRSSHECSIPCGLLINARPGLRLHLSLTSRKPLLPAPCLHPQVAGSRFLTRPVGTGRMPACLWLCQQPWDPPSSLGTCRSQGPLRLHPGGCNWGRGGLTGVTVPGRATRKTAQPRTLALPTLTTHGLGRAFTHSPTPSPRAPTADTAALPSPRTGRARLAADAGSLQLSLH